MRTSLVDRTRREPRQGQALVEFAVAIIPFMILMMGVLDLGRAIYTLNGTAEAAREIARVTSVHLTDGVSTDLGSSTEAQAVIATQRGLIPNLVFTSSSDIDCVDIGDNVIPDADCTRGNDYYIRVHVRVTFTPVTPIVAMFGSHTFDSWSRIGIP